MIPSRARPLLGLLSTPLPPILELAVLRCTDGLGLPAQELAVGLELAGVGAFATVSFQSPRVRFSRDTFSRDSLVGVVPVGGKPSHAILTGEHTRALGDISGVLVLGGRTARREPECEQGTRTRARDP